MKRAGQLMRTIAEPGNLRLAFWKAAKGKRDKPSCLTFQAGLDDNLEELREDLLGERVALGDYHYFQIRDPKERTICAASFRERVLHHALMNVVEPILERAAIFDSYACRRGKGRLAAINRAQRFAGEHLTRRSKVRFARKLRRYEAAFVDGRWTELQLQQRVQALVGFVQPAECYAYRRHVIERFGVITTGLEPRDSRWQLEQQRQELPVRQPQQQHAGQPEQQHRVPRRPGPSSTLVSEDTAADPAIILSAK